MAPTQLLNRNEIPVDKTWDLTTLYASQEKWEEEFGKIDGLLEKVLLFKGRLAGSAETLAAFMKIDEEFSRLLERLYSYSHLKSDENTADSHNLGLVDRITGKFYSCKAQISWISPEIIAIEDARFEELMEKPELKEYRLALTRIRRYKPYTLSEKEERLLAMAGELAQLPYKAFSMMNNADIKFPEVNDGTGKKIEMSHGTYSRLLENRNRDVRKGAFNAMYSTFDRMKNTLAATLDGAVKSHIFEVQARNHKNSLAASLFRDNVDESIYHNLIDTINKNHPLLHRYIALRKKRLGLSDLNMYDMYVPLLEEYDLKVSWEQACAWVTEALKPLGEEYCAVVKKALRERWIDVLECRGKRSGAYSGGCYDSNPYILLNYNETLSGVFTLVHELGHSLHTHFSKKYRPYTYAEYTIFVAEVASTTNEMLLWNHLITTTADKRLKLHLLNHLCEDFRTTMFRQVQFAEFEREIHAMAEQGKPLSADSLSKHYYDINAKYYGPDVIPDRLIELEWARIPHFYYNFYVYKYATGFSAAIAFSETIVGEGGDRTRAYLDFLKAGSSKDPLDILKDAGVDLSRPEPLQKALIRFGKTLDELEKSLGT